MVCWWVCRCVGKKAREEGGGAGKGGGGGGALGVEAGVNGYIDLPTLPNYNYRYVRHYNFIPHRNSISIEVLIP